jgi:hypothetical protein
VWRYTRLIVKLTLLIVACLVISLFCLGYPMYVIRPFRHQGVYELAVALAVLRIRLVVMALCVAAALFATFGRWRAQRKWLPRVASAAGVVILCVLAGLSRVNIYERMFSPIGEPAFQPAEQSKLAGDEKVIAVRVAGIARAYPIRSISYHHVVNDTVGGVPIVATY